MHKYISVALAGSAASLLAAIAPLLEQSPGKDEVPTLEPLASIATLGRWLGDSVTDSLFGNDALAAGIECDAYGGDIAVYAIIPDLAINQGQVDATVYGFCFLDAPTVSLVLDSAIPNETVYATNVTFVSTTELSATFDLTGSTAGSWDVVLFNYPYTTTLEDGLLLVETPKITHIVPDRGGDSGAVDALVYAHEIEDNAQIALARNGEQDINGTLLDPIVCQAGVCRVGVRFDLNGEALGSWNLVVTNPSAPSTPIELEDGFQIEPGAEIPDVKVSIVGPSLFRQGRPTVFTIGIENQANVNSRGVPIIQGIPGNVTIDGLNIFNPMAPDAVETIFESPSGDERFLSIPSLTLAPGLPLRINVQLTAPAETSFKINGLWNQQ